MSIDSIKAQIGNSNKFKTYCIQEFGDKIGKEIVEFYKKTLSINGTLTKQEYDYKANRNKKSYESSTDKYYKSISHLVETYSKESIIASMKNFIFKQQVGELSNNSIAYFAGFVKNEFNKTFERKFEKKEPSLAKEVQSISSEIIVCKPVQSGVNKKPSFERSQGFVQDIYYWQWACGCGVEVDQWQEACDKCKSSIDWENLIVDTNFLKKG